MSGTPVIYDEPEPGHDPQTCPAAGQVRDARAWGRYAYETAGRLRSALAAVRETLPTSHKGYALINEALKVDAKARVWVTAVSGSATLKYHVGHECALDSLTDPVKVPAYVAELVGEPCDRCHTPDDLTRARTSRIPL